MNITERDFSGEITFRTSRSGGKGGQHVNKVETKVELCFDVLHSQLLSEEEKSILLHRLRNRINEEGVLKITCQSERSQLGNKMHTVVRFYELLENSLRPVKKRVPTKPTRSSKKRRLNKKKKRSEKKQLRQGRWERE